MMRLSGPDRWDNLCIFCVCVADLRGAQVSCSQTKAGRSGKMDSNSKHCPSRSSADNLAKQPTCADDQKDPKTLPTSCATSSATEDRTPSPGNEAGNSRQSPASCGMEEMAASKTEGAVVGVNGKEDCVTSTSQTVDRPSGASPQRPEHTAASCGPTPCVGGEPCANERLAGADAPSPQLGSSGTDVKSGKDDASALAAQSQSEATPQGTKRYKL